MPKYTTADLRNVGVIGHGDAGKTTLVSACLYTSGAQNRLGRVEDGQAVTDFDAQEIERQISIQAALAHTDWKGAQITFIDTPGYAVFRAETKGALRVADGAIVVVDGLDGVGVMTEKVWEYRRDDSIPAVILINRLDRENSDFAHAVEGCVDAFGREAVPVQLPIGSGHDFKGIVDLVQMKAYTYEVDGKGKGKVGAVPDDMADAARTARAALVEMVAESNEELMNLFFEQGDLDEEQLTQGIRAAVHRRRLHPVLCGAPGHGIGTDRILDACVRLLPSPFEHPQLIGHDAEGHRVFAETDPEAPFAALVFKTVSDDFAGRINFLKVFAGTLRADDHAINVRTGADERLTNLSSPQGKELQHIDAAVAGQICAVAKLKGTGTSDTLRAKGSELEIEHVEFPRPAISFAIEPESKHDEEKISAAIARLTDEDPVLDVHRDPQTHELVLAGVGQLHVEVTLAKLKGRFGVSAKLHPPKVPYRETIRARAEAEGRHKKQSGGRGQFGVATIAIEPLPAGSGFQFEDKIFGGSISHSYRPAVEKGIIEAAAHGVLAGFPLVDFKAELLDGKEHSVDSSEMAFKIAGSMAFKEAVPKARPVLLEPIMKIEVTVPDEALGDVMGDLTSRRGRVQGMDPRRGRQIIKAEVPLAEVLTYAIDLTSLTGGRGSYTMEFSRYDDVPVTVARQIIEQLKQNDEATH